MKTPFLFGALGLWLLLGSTNTHAAAMYCGNELIQEGMTKLDVISK